MKGLALGAVIALSLANVPAAQQATPPPQQPGLTFRSTANYVEIDAIVTDERGDVARNLEAADFEVVEDGKPQTLSVCSFIDIPVKRSDPLLFMDRVVEPDVVTNARPFDGRVFMIVLDGYHIDTRRTTEVKKEAAKFIDRYLGENDLAAVVQVGNGAAGQEFTNNKRLLKAAVDRFMGTGLQSETESILRDALQKNNEAGATFDPGPAHDTDRQVREFMARESLEVVRRLAQDLTELNGRRKALLLFSEGIGIDLLKADDAANREGDSPFLESASNIPSVIVSQRAMISAATRANVSIYTIDPRGLATGGLDAAMPGTPAASLSGGRNYANPGMAGDVVAEQRRSQDSLRTISEATGGLAIVDENNMDGAFDRIVRDNSSYYILGYRSADPRRDGRYHRMSVKAKRPGLHVRTRTGYFAPSDTVMTKRAAITDPVVKLIATPTPISGLGMRASASVIKGLLAKSTVHLTIEFSGQDVTVKREGQVLTNDVTVEYAAIDMKGAIQANGREIAHLQLAPKFHATYPQNGIRYLHEFELAPGRYQLRVAARDTIGGRAGSVFLDLDVPDFATVPIGMSDLFITASSADRTATGKSSPGFGQLLPTPPVTSRTFTKADTVTALAAFYDNVAGSEHRVDLVATVQSDTGAKVFSREETRDAAELNAAKGGYRWILSVPLANLAPGRYVLTVEARSRLKDMPSVKKEVEFRVQ